MKKDATIIILGRIVQFLLNILVIKLITRFLSKEQVATYFLVLSVLNYFGLALISPIGQYFNRSINRWKEEKVLLNRIFNYSIFILVLCLFSGPFFHLLSLRVKLFERVGSLTMTLVILFGVISTTWITTIVPVFNFLGMRISYVIYTNLMIILGLTGSYLTINFFGVNVINWFIGQFLFLLILFCVGVTHLALFKNLAFSLEESFQSLSTTKIKEVLSFSAPLFLSTFFMWLSTDSFRFILEKTHGLEYLGLLSVGFIVAQKLSFAGESLIQQILFPYFYKEMDQENQERRERSWLALFYISLPCYLGIMLLTILLRKYLILFFSDDSYSSASIFVAYAAVFHFFRKLSATFAMVAHSERKTKLLVWPYFFGAITATIPLLLINNKNDNLPVVVLVMSSFITFIVMYLSTSNILTIRFDKKVIYDIKESFFE